MGVFSLSIIFNLYHHPLFYTAIQSYVKYGKCCGKTGALRGQKLRNSAIEKPNDYCRGSSNWETLKVLSTDLASGAAGSHRINCLERGRADNSPLPFSNLQQQNSAIAKADFCIIFFTHAPESHARKGVDEWSTPTAFGAGFRAPEPVDGNATAVRLWSASHFTCVPNQNFLTIPRSASTPVPSRQSGRYGAGSLASSMICQLHYCNSLRISFGVYRFRSVLSKSVSKLTSFALSFLAAQYWWASSKLKR